jgi:hypothetical protein
MDPAEADRLRARSVAEEVAILHAETAATAATATNVPAIVDICLSQTPC